MTALDILKKARALLARPYAWTKNTSKRLVRVPGKKRRKCAYCATGAIAAVCSEGSFERMRARQALREQIPFGMSGIESFNDRKTTTKRDVLALFDRAIARLEQGQ